MANIANQPTVMPINNVNVPRVWHWLALGAIGLLAIFMDFFQLGQNGYGNLYYAAGIRSMADNWHNFFFVAFDPGGFVTIDKPPLGFWLQVMSTKVFGFTPFSIFFPQALCGVLAVLLLFFLIRRHFGVVAGLVAALVLAVSPISVVTNRNNTIDGTLALALLLAAWAVIHAAETGKLRWLLLSGVFVGIGFNIKMSEAYLVVPALGLTYLLCAPRSIWTRIWHLLLTLIVMLVISLSWAAAVDLTPTAQRPYVGSTQDNSELSLAFGYNGLSRLHIGNARPGGNASLDNRPASSPSTNGNSGNAENAANQLEALQGGGFRTGAASPLALFSAAMGGQIGWLLAFALLAIIALACQRRFNFREDRQQLGLVLWGFWLLTMAIFFTLDGSFHQYYMTEMAPGLGAMVGIGVVVMWQEYRSAGWRSWFLPLALVLTAAVQIYILTSYPVWSRWLSPLIAGLTVLAVLLLLILRLRPRITMSGPRVRLAGAVASIGLLILLVAPTIWAGYSVMRNVESSDPTAGPAAQSNARGGAFQTQGNRPSASRTGESDRNQNGVGNLGNLAGAFAGFLGGGSGQADPTLVTYLEAHQGNAKFLVATPSSSSADAIILSTNRPVMAMGGFGGSDPILTTSELQTLISDGTVRFFLINAPRGTQVGQGADRGAFFTRGGSRQNTLSSWISSHCSAVPANAWQASTRNTAAGLSGSQLYDCASAHS